VCGLLCGMCVIGENVTALHAHTRMLVCGLDIILVIAIYERFKDATLHCFT
jgi:aryl carrier-like protein